MSIRLLMSVLISGVSVAADGAELALSDALEADLVAQGKAVWVSKPGQRTDLTLHADAHAQMGVAVARRKPAASSIYTRRQLIGERQTRATYHATFLASGDFYAVSPIIAVTRAPTDATYTNDDIYDAIAVAPTNAILTGGLPNASGGNASWTVSANQVFARQPGASTTAPVLVTGTPIACRSIPRVDGGPGRLAMTRMWSLGSIHAQAATTRMPTVDDSPVGTLANNQLWDAEFPLAGVGQYYYKNSTDHASTDQGSFGSVATRWAASCLIGAKFHYAKPSITVLGVGDSLMGGDYNESGRPARCSYGWRAAYKLMSEGRQVDFINAGYSGYKWDQFGPMLQQLVTQLKPDILLMPIHSGNGISSGVGIGYTAADANLHVAIAMQYAEWALNNGVKEVIFATPMPSTTAGYNAMYAHLASVVKGSGFPYLDTMAVVANSDMTWKSGYSIDGGHPTAAANDVLANALADVLRPFSVPA